MNFLNFDNQPGEPVPPSPPPSEKGEPKTDIPGPKVRPSDPNPTHLDPHEKSDDAPWLPKKPGPVQR